MVLFVRAMYGMYRLPPPGWNPLGWLLFLLLMAVVSVLEFGDIVRKFGWWAIAVKAGLILDGWVVLLFVLFWPDPIANLILRHRGPQNIGLFLLGFGALIWALSSDRATRWLVARKEWVLIPALMIVLVFAWTAHSRAAWNLLPEDRGSPARPITADVLHSAEWRETDRVSLGANGWL